MKRERLLNAIGQIDDRLISGANPEIQARKKKARRQWVAALAACLALILCIGVVAPTVLGNKEADARYHKYLEALEQPDINYISVKISGIYAQTHSLNYEESFPELVRPVRVNEKCLVRNG